MGISQYLLVDEERHSHVEDGLHRRLRYEGDILQALRERAGVVHLLGIGVSRGDGARPRLKREVDARRAPVGVLGTSIRSTADEARPPAWPSPSPLPLTGTHWLHIIVPKLLPVIITRVLAPPSLGVKSVISTGLPGS